MTSRKTLKAPLALTYNLRLNYQHDFFTSFGPPLLLHPTIPIEKLVRIADVATGTGYVNQLATPNHHVLLANRAFA